MDYVASEAGAKITADLTDYAARRRLLICVIRVIRGCYPLCSGLIHGPNPGPNSGCVAYATMIAWPGLGKANG